jgi:hypothetical protein
LFLDFFFAVTVYEIARWPDWNRVDRGNFLQNESVLSAHDVHGLALSGFFHQPSQIGFGGAQAEAVRPQIEFPSSERTIRSFHRLTVGCSWPGVEWFLRTLTPTGARQNSSRGSRDRDFLLTYI